MGLAVPEDPTRPHCAVLTVWVEVHEVLAGGELANRPLRKEKKLFRVDGQDRWLCERKLDEVLQELRKCSS